MLCSGKFLDKEGRFRGSDATRWKFPALGPGCKGCCTLKEKFLGRVEIRMNGTLENSWGGPQVQIHSKAKCEMERHSRKFLGGSRSKRRMERPPQWDPGGM